MKIAFLHNANNPHVNTRIKHFIKSGHRVFYFGLPPIDEPKVQDSVTFIGIRTNRFVEKIKPLKIVLNIIRLRRLIKQHQIDVLHIMWLGNCVYAPFLNPGAIVFENMGSDVLVKPHHSLIWRMFIRIVYKFSDAVIQDSKVAQDAGIKYGAPKENNQILEVGIDFSVFNTNVKSGIARNRLSLKGDQEFIFSPRSFTQLYNIDIIIKSIRKVIEVFPKATFVFCRFHDDLEDSYKQLIFDEGVQDSIAFAGFLDNETELPYFFKDADLVISVPSSDSSPRTVYEAMACGTPVIVSELPWHQDKFVHKTDILTVPVKDSESLAKAIIQLLNKDIQLNTDQAFEKVFLNINMDSENQKLEQLYNRLLKAD
jgi:glycosyltransferase involved in cell wall biosynthesis